MSRSSEWTTSLSPPTEAHPWLKEKVYEPKRQRTVALVQQAVDALVKERQKVSLSSVSRKSKELDEAKRGVSESGILNNPDAKAYYDRHKSWQGAPSRNSTGGGRADNVAPSQRPIDPNRDTGRVKQRLMRKSKDELIDRVLALEQSGAVQEEQWLCVNDNLLEWRLRAEKAEAQVVKMRSALDAKDAQLRDLRQKLDGLATVRPEEIDTEACKALQEAFNRAQRAEQLADDLRLRLFAKNIVRTRDKVRRLDKKGPAKLHRSTE